MKRYEFDTYQEYLEAQRRVTLEKHSRLEIKCWTEIAVAESIADYHSTPVAAGICHGVRHGEEIEMMSTAFGQGHWIGTEIVDELCDGKIVCADFETPVERWSGAFDVVYSNSLDHARDPATVIRNWVSQLSTSGRLYIEWTHGHKKLGSGCNLADCFAADFDEYRELLGDGCEAVLEPKTINMKRWIFVVRGIS